MDFKEHYNEASRLAFEEVKTLARKILKKKTNLGEFILGMGIWCFTKRDDGETLIMVGDNMPKWAKPIDDIISEWDDVLKITGNPVRFTAYGPEVTGR